MRRVIAVLGALVLSCTAAQGANLASVAPLSAPTAAQNAKLFAGGGTPLTNGIFFPGTGIYDGSKYTTVAPLRVTRGTNVDFINLDPAVATNSHQIRSIRVKKVGKRRVPVFQSSLVVGPAQGVMITSNVKPGVYEYMCTIHGGMRGFLEVVPE